VTPSTFLVPFPVMVDHCWGVLKQSLVATFPTTTRAHPSSWVYIQPGRFSYPGEFWQGLSVPVLTQLVGVTPPYRDGWKNPMARNLVDAYLRKALVGSPWAPFVTGTGL
jgi:hypothetical protein